MATNQKTKGSAKNTEPDKSSKQTISENSTERVAKDIDLSQFIPVYNGFQGKLVYISPRTKEVFKWDSFGDVQEIELRELKNAKSASKAFFVNNWFMFDEDDAWVIDYLGMNKFYKHAISIDHFDDIFTKTPKEIREPVSQLSAGQKRSVAYRARQLIKNNEIDSIKAISALEESLGEELIEK